MQFTDAPVKGMRTRLLTDMDRPSSKYDLMRVYKPGEPDKPLLVPGGQRYQFAVCDMFPFADPDIASPVGPSFKVVERPRHELYYEKINGHPNTLFLARHFTTEECDITEGDVVYIPGPDAALGWRYYQGPALVRMADNDMVCLEAMGEMKGFSRIVPREHLGYTPITFLRFANGNSPIRFYGYPDWSGNLPIDQ